MIPTAINEEFKEGTGEGRDCSIFVSDREKGGLLSFNSRGGTAPGRSREAIHYHLLTSF